MPYNKSQNYKHSRVITSDLESQEFIKEKAFNHQDTQSLLCEDKSHVPQSLSELSKEQTKGQINSH